MNRDAGIVVGFTLALALPGCFKCSCLPPPAEADCANGVDDDGDDLADCQDPDCAARCADAAFADAGPVCGDDVVEPPEECDGVDVGGRTCFGLGFTGGAVGCAPDCALDLSGCTGCGNGIVEAGEECDATDLGGADCTALGFMTGALACAPSCTYDASACTTCGNGLLEPGEECDDANGIDDDACSNQCLIDCSPSAWSKWPGNPVMEGGPPGEWDGFGVQPGNVLREGGVHRMWYSGFDGLVWRIGHATSPDGIAWTRDAMVFDVLPGSWDSQAARDAHVLFDGVEYRMWYSGFDGTDWRVLDAVSPDGFAWTRGGIVWEDLDDAPPCCETVGAMQPFAWPDGGDFGVLYVSQDENPTLPAGYRYVIRRIGVGTLLDPAYTDVPAGDLSATHPFAALAGLGWRVFYASDDGTNDRIAMAVGVSLAGQVVAHGVILDLGAPGAWDDVHLTAPAAILDADVWNVWYAGFDGGTWRIGYATAACATP